MRISSLFIIVLCILSSCDLIREKEQPNITPWGEVIEDDDDENAEKQANDSIESNQMSLGDIVNAGELIMLTMSDLRHIMSIADMDLACIISFVRSLRKS